MVALSVPGQPDGVFEMRVLDNLSIGKKLFVVFAMLLFVSIGASAATYRTLAFIQTSNGWTDHTYRVLSAIDGAMSAMIDQETGFRGFLLTGRDGSLAPYRSGRKEFERQWSTARDLTADNPAQQTRLAELRTLADQWRDQIAEPAIALMSRTDGQAEARSFEIKGLGKESMDGIRRLVGEIGGAERGLLTTRSQDQADAFSRGFMTTIASAAILLAIAVALGLALSRMIGNPVLAMTATMKRLAQGDREVTIPGLGRGDEVGGMASALEVFKQNAIEADHLAAAQRAEDQAKLDRMQTLSRLTAGFESKMSAVIGALADAAGDMQSAATSLSSTAEQTNQQSLTVASASDQASANVQTVAAAAEQLTCSINEIAGQMEHSNRVSRTAVDSASQASAVIGGLSDAAKRIGEVMQLINSIADQTNLLALNATIEAARAGDAGKGFAVVASEVKTLASQTRKATDDIAQQVTSIQGSTEEAVRAVNEITQIIGEMSQISATIAAAVEEQGCATREISHNVQQAASGTTAVNETISGVARAAANTGRAAQQVNTASSAIGQRSRELRSEVEDFLAHVKAA